MKAPLAVALSLLAAAGAAAAQAPPKPGPSEERPEAAPGPRLNLKLDNPRQYTRDAPPEGGASAEALPSLGGNARPLLPPGPMPTTAGPYPTDTQRGER